MSEEEKTIENLRKNKGVSFAEADIILNLIEEQQKEIEKQNKVINELIQEYEYNAGINVKDFCEDCQRKDKCIQDCHTHIKQYFIRKVEENDNRTS